MSDSNMDKLVRTLTQAKTIEDLVQSICEAYVDADRPRKSNEDALAKMHSELYGPNVILRGRGAGNELLFTKKEVDNAKPTLRTAKHHSARKVENATIFAVFQMLIRKDAEMDVGTNKVFTHKEVDVVLPQKVRAFLKNQQAELKGTDAWFAALGKAYRVDIQVFDATTKHQKSFRVKTSAGDNTHKFGSLGKMLVKQESGQNILVRVALYDSPPDVTETKEKKKQTFKSHTLKDDVIVIDDSDAESEEAQAPDDVIVVDEGVEAGDAGPEISKRVQLQADELDAFDDDNVIAEYQHVFPTSKDGRLTAKDATELLDHNWRAWRETLKEFTKMIPSLEKAPSSSNSVKQYMPTRENIGRIDHFLSEWHADDGVFRTVVLSGNGHFRTVLDEFAEAWKKKTSTLSRTDSARAGLAFGMSVQPVASVREHDEDAWDTDDDGDDDDKGQRRPEHWKEFNTQVLDGVHTRVFAPLASKVRRQLVGVKSPVGALFSPQEVRDAQTPIQLSSLLKRWQNGDENIKHAMDEFEVFPVFRELLGHPEARKQSNLISFPDQLFDLKGPYETLVQPLLESRFTPRANANVFVNEKDQRVRLIRSYDTDASSMSNITPSQDLWWASLGRAYRVDIQFRDQQKRRASNKDGKCIKVLVYRHDDDAVRKYGPLGKILVLIDKEGVCSIGAMEFYHAG